MTAAAGRRIRVASRRSAGSGRPSGPGDWTGSQGPDRPADPSAEPILWVRDVRAGFGTQTIIHGVSLGVAPGRVTGLFGLNGAGKSVLLKVIAGLVPVWSGRVELLGRDITNLAAEKRVGRGMAHIPQGRQVFATMTVEQNLRVGAYTLRRRDKARYQTNLDRVYDIFPRLAERRTQAAGTMSGGEQAMLAIGRALINDPQLVLIDEPSAGLAPAIVEDLLEVLLGVRDLGLTMLLVEQNIRFGLRLSDEVNLLQKGRIVYSGRTAELDQETMASYLGVGRLLSRDLSAGLTLAVPPAPPGDGAPKAKPADPTRAKRGPRLPNGS